MSQQKFGRYIIKGTLGRGAMGMVYLAVDPILDRPSAIKVMNTGGEVDEGLRTRFFREAKSAAKLRHPNIIAIYEMGEEGKRPFIAMEYVEGEDLKILLEKKVFIPLEQKIKILIQVCEALHYAHQQGVIHRDIKPANVRIALDGDVRILDFGLARLGSSDITRTGMLMGTPYYMSPEQVRGSRDLDGRSDQFSASVLLYELISYARPFEAETSTEVCFKIVSEPHIPLTSVLPKADGDLVAIIDRALSKDREERFSNCQEFARALKEYLQTIPEKLRLLQQDVQSLEDEWRSCCEQSRHLVQLGILEESLLAPVGSSPGPSGGPQETLQFQNPMMDSRKDLGTLLLIHARLYKRIRELRQRLEAAIPLQRLFALVQQQFDSRELELCLKTTAEILQTIPQNERAVEMQRECQRLIEEHRLEEERRARLQQALSLASEALQLGNLAQCIQAASRALQIDPRNAQGEDLKRKASDALIQRKKVTELLAAARGYHKTQNHEACVQVCREALDIEPAHAELKVLLEQSLRILERQRHLRELLKQGQECLDAGNYSAVLGITEQLLTLESGLPRALEMQQQAAESLEKELKFEELFAAARGYQLAGDFETCIHVCEQALHIKPDHEDVQQLHANAKEDLTRHKKVLELLERAASETQNGDFSGAAETCQEVLRLDPANASAQKLLQRSKTELEKLKRIAELLTEAQSCQSQRNYQECIRLTSEALTLNPHHTAHRELNVQARAALEKERKFRQLLREALQQEQSENFTQAVQTLETALRLDPENEDALTATKRVTEKLDRQIRLNTSLQAARNHFNAENYLECQNAAAAVLELEPAHTEALALKEHSEKHLARIETENQLLSQSQRLFDKHQFEAAVDIVDQLLRMNPSHPQGQALKREALQTQERRQRFEALLVAARNHARAQNYEACLDATSEALTLEPQNVEILRLQEKAVQAFERARLITEGLDRCKQCYANEDFSAALESLEELLRLDPDNREGLLLQQQAAAELERQQRFEELLVAAREYQKVQNYAACLQASEEGLNLKPDHAEMRKFFERSSQALERLKTIETGIQTAQKALAEERFQEAIDALRPVFSTDEHNAAAVEINSLAAAGIEREERIKAVTRVAQERFQSNDYGEGLQAVNEGLALAPDRQTLLDLKLGLEKAVARQQQLAALMDQARQHLDSRDYSAAIERADRCLEIEAGQPEALSIQQVASEGLERRQKAEELLAEANGYFTAKDYESCLNSLQNGLELEPNDAALLALRDQAQESLETERRLAQLFETARRDFGEKRWPEACSALEEILAVDPAQKQALDLKHKVQQAWNTAQQLEQRLSEARRQAGLSNWEACLNQAQEGLKLDSSQPELKHLQQEAERELERRNRIKDLLKQAQTQARDRQFERVVQSASIILELAPNHKEALDFRKKAQAALDRERQLKTLLDAAKSRETAEELESALQLAGEGLQLDPNHSQFLEIRRRVSKALEHRLRAAKILSKARQCLSQGNFRGAVESADELLALESENREARQIRGTAAEELERAQAIGRSVELARSRAAQGLLEDSLSAASEGLKLSPDHPDLKRLFADASRALEKQHQFDDLISKAQSDLSRGDEQAAIDHAEQALQLLPDQAEAAKLLQTAKTSLVERERKARVESLLKQARDSELDDPETCYRAASEGLVLEPDHPNLKALRDRSREVLHKRRQIELLLEQLNQAWSAREFERTLELAERVLELEPLSDQGKELKGRAHEQIVRRERIKEKLAHALQAHQAGDYQASVRSADEGLDLDSEHKELLQIRRRSLESLQRIQTVTESLETARQLMAGESYQKALPVLDRALELDTSNDEATRLKAVALEAIERLRRARAMLSEAQACCQTRDFEACLRLAAQGLELVPGDDKFRALQKQAEQQLEVERLVREALQKAQMHLGQLQFAEAVKSFGRVLDLDPSNAEAKTGKAAAEESLRRFERLQAALLTAKQSFESGNYEACITATVEGLNVDPSNSELKQLSARAQALFERSNKIQGLQREIMSRHQGGDWPACLKSIDELLQIDPENASARELRPHITEAIEKQRQISGLLAKAASAEKRGELATSLQLAVDALKIDSNHVQARQYQERIQQELERLQQIEKLLKQAQLKFADNDDEATLQILAKLLRLDPENHDGRKLESETKLRLEYRQRIKTILARAYRSFEERDFSECVRFAEAGLRLEPEHSTFLELRATSEKELARQEEIRGLVTKAREQFAAGDYEGTIALSKALEATDAGNTIAADLLQKSTLALQRHKELKALLDRARKLIDAEEFAVCSQVCDQALKLDPQNAAFHEIRNRSLQVIEAQRREEERQQRIAQLLRSAEGALEKCKPRQAQRDLKQLIAIDPENRRAQGLLENCQRQLEFSKAAQRKILKIAALALFTTGLLSSGIWYGAKLLNQPARSRPDVLTKAEPPIKDAEQKPPVQNADGTKLQEIARLLEVSRASLRARHYSDAVNSAEALLSLSPSHDEGLKIKQEAQGSLETINSGLKRARALLGRRQYGEVATVLGTVLALDSSQPEALHMMSQLDRYARSNAEDARQAMLQMKVRAGEAGASPSGPGQFQTAALLENAALKLFDNQKFGEATGKFYEANDAYRRAESEARSRIPVAPPTPQTQKPEQPSGTATNSAPPQTTPERQQSEEPDRQVALQRSSAQASYSAYQKALQKANQSGADRLAAEGFQQATTLGGRAQDKMAQSNYSGAQADFVDATRQLESISVHAEEVMRQQRAEQEKRDQEAAQRTAGVQSIQRLLKQYQQGMEDRNVEVLRQTGLGDNILSGYSKMFKFAKSVKASVEPLTEARFSAEGSASIRCLVTIRSVMKDGPPISDSRERTFVFRRSGGNWIISSLQE